MEHWGRKPGLRLRLCGDLLILALVHDLHLLQSSPGFIFLLKGAGSPPIHRLLTLGSPLPFWISGLRRRRKLDLGDNGYDRLEDDLVWAGWGLGGGGGSLGCDFPGTSFPGWPSIKSRRLVGGFLLKPISAWEEVS